MKLNQVKILLLYSCIHDRNNRRKESQEHEKQEKEISPRRSLKPFLVRFKVPYETVLLNIKEKDGRDEDNKGKKRSKQETQPEKRLSVNEVKNTLWYVKVSLRHKVAQLLPKVLPFKVNNDTREETEKINEK